MCVKEEKGVKRTQSSAKTGIELQFGIGCSANTYDNLQRIGIPPRDMRKK